MPAASASKTTARSSSRLYWVVSISSAGDMQPPPAMTLRKSTPLAQLLASRLAAGVHAVDHGAAHADRVLDRRPDFGRQAARHRGRRSGKAPCRPRGAGGRGSAPGPRRCGNPGRRRRSPEPWVNPCARDSSSILEGADGRHRGVRAPFELGEIRLHQRTHEHEASIRPGSRVCPRQSSTRTPGGSVPGPPLRTSLIRLPSTTTVPPARGLARPCRRG